MLAEIKYVYLSFLSVYIYFISSSLILVSLIYNFLYIELDIFVFSIFILILSNILVILMCFICSLVYLYSFYSFLFISFSLFIFS